MNSLKFFVTHKKQLKPIYHVYSRTCTRCPPHRDPIVTVIDAYSRIGKNVALLLKQCPLIGELRLYDKNNNICAVAEDLSHIDTRTKVSSFGGSSVLKHAIMDADIVITIGGCRSSLKETEHQLFSKNMDDVRTAALHMIEFNPKALFLVAKPPIEAFVPLISEEYKKAGVYDNRKIIGVTTVGTMRANHYVAAATGQNPIEVLCPVVGGLSPECLVAVISQARPNVGLHPQDYASIQKSISKCENDIMKVYANCGSICLTPALGISRFINTLLRALRGDTNCVECAFVRQTGHIGQFLPYMISIVRLGRHGVMSSHMPKVNGAEAHLLKKASYIIQKHIRMGETFATGEHLLQREICIPNEAKETEKADGPICKPPETKVVQKNI